MKKLLILICLLTLPIQSFSVGFPVTDILRFIMEFITNEVLMEEDKVIQNKKLQKLLEVLQEAKKIRARHTELKDMAEDVEAELRLARSVRELKLHDLLPIIDKVVSVSNALYAEDMPYLEEYTLLKSAIPGMNRVNPVYDFMLGSTSVYGEITARAPVTFQANAELAQEQAIKQYGLEVDAAKRSLHTSMAYEQLAADLREQAVDLQTQVNREGHWELLGIGDIFSDLLDVSAELPPLNLSGLVSKMGEWAKDIREKAKLSENPLGNLWGEQEDKSEQIRKGVEEAVSSFDFGGLLGSVLGGVANRLPIAEYRTRIEKDGMRMTTGERIETQGVALDNLEQSLELQLEADRLMLDVLQKSEHQHKVDASYQNALIRKSLTQISFQP